MLLTRRKCIKATLEIHTLASKQGHIYVLTPTVQKTVYPSRSCLHIRHVRKVEKALGSDVLAPRKVLFSYQIILALRKVGTKALNLLQCAGPYLSAFRIGLIYLE